MYLVFVIVWDKSFLHAYFQTNAYFETMTCTNSYVYPFDCDITLDSIKPRHNVQLLKCLTEPKLDHWNHMRWKIWLTLVS